MSFGNELSNVEPLTGEDTGVPYESDELLGAPLGNELSNKLLLTGEDTGEPQDSDELPCTLLLTDSDPVVLKELDASFEAELLTELLDKGLDTGVP